MKGYWRPSLAFIEKGSQVEQYRTLEGDDPTLQYKVSLRLSITVNRRREIIAMWGTADSYK